MAIQQESEGGQLVPRISGVNQRFRYTNPNPNELDELTGWIQQRAGVLGRIPGAFQLYKIEGRKILGFCQTFDNRRNVIVQTDLGVYKFSEDELMGRVIATNLTRDAISDEENMAKAILIHSVAPGTNGGTYTVANTWQTAPLNAILSQLNPDGSPAGFVTGLASNVFTLSAGTYRFSGWSIMAPDAGHRTISRLYNVTADAPAWNGLGNQQGPVILVDTNNGNTPSHFGGDLTIAGLTDFRIENFASQLKNNTGFGFPRTIGGGNEVYRWLEILKTA